MVAMALSRLRKVQWPVQALCLKPSQIEAAVDQTWILRTGLDKIKFMQKSNKIYFNDENKANYGMIMPSDRKYDIYCYTIIYHNGADC